VEAFKTAIVKAKAFDTVEPIEQVLGPTTASFAA
jgi:hypothetical protein